MYCCYKRSLPAIYFHLLALLSPFNGEEKKVFLFSLIRYNNVCFDNKNRGNCISSVFGKILLWLDSGGNNWIHTDSFFLLEIRGRTTRNFLCSASYILLCLDKVLLVAPMLFLCFFSGCLYFAPCTDSKTASKLARQTKIVRSDLSSDHQKTSHLASPEQLWQLLALLWYFVEGLL